MSENNQLTFAAVIRISMPDSPEIVTAQVVLTADDAVTTEDGRFKPLHACTIADLQTYADALEAEVWQTYETIKLIDLADDEAVNVDLTVTDASGNPITPSRDWFKKAHIVPKKGIDPQETTPDESETAVSEDDTPFVAEFVDDEPDANEDVPDVVDEPETEQSEPAPDAASDKDTATQSEGADVTEQPSDPSDMSEIVSEEQPPAEPATQEESEPEDSEPVTKLITVAEPEPVFEEPEADVYRDPWIAPSQARVRVAGRRLPNGHPTWAAVDILMDETALRSAQAHALTSLDREVAGVMIGPRPEKQPDGRYVVHVIDTIIAKYTVMQGASVTYTPESWRYMNDKLMERYPDETAVIVGWYHTHPGFGIFLSGMDQFIHQNFFTQIWHIAYVLDPRARTSGFFCWDRQKTRVSPFEFHWPSWAARSW